MTTQQDALRKALEAARMYVASQNGAEHMLDGFGGRKPRPSDADLAAIDAALEATAEPGQPQEDEVPYLIVFDDQDRKPELCIGSEVARLRYEQISMSWNAHLYVKIDSNSRDCEWPNATPAAAAEPEQPVAHAQVGKGPVASFVHLTDAGRALPPGKYDLFASPQAQVKETAATLTNGDAKEREWAAMPEWISVEDRLPETTVTDDSECWLQGKRIAAAIHSDRVLVALSGGGVRVDRLEGLEGKPPYWDAYRGRVTHWQPLPAAPSPENKQ